MFEVAEGYEVTMGAGAGSWRLCFWSLSVSAMVRGCLTWGVALRPSRRRSRA